MIFPEVVPNPQIRYFNVRRRLTDSSILMYNSKDWERIEIADMGLLRKFTSLFLGEGGKLMRHEHNEMMKNKKLIDALFDINGVQRVTVTQFSVGIEKGKAFEWTNLEPSIFKVLQKYNLDV
jgi:hypothetical protein